MRSINLMSIASIPFDNASNVLFICLQVLSYFTAKLETCDKNISVPQVLEIVTQGAMQFRKDRLKVSGIFHKHRPVAEVALDYSLWPV